VRHGERQTFDTKFGGRIGAARLEANHAGHRTDVDDPAGTLLVSFCI